MTSTRSERLFDDGCYLGFFDSVADYAQEITEVPDHLQHYVDSESMARDMELNGDIFINELGHEVHIFMSH